MTDIEHKVYEGEIVEDEIVEDEDTSSGITLKSYEDHVNAYVVEEEGARKHQWRQCAIASSFVGKFEKDLVKSFAKDTGSSVQTIYDQARAHRLRTALPKDYGQPETLSPTHYVEASYAEDPQQMLEEAEDDSLSTHAIRERVKEKKQESAEQEHGASEVVVTEPCPQCEGTGRIIVEKDPEVVEVDEPQVDLKRDDLGGDAG